MESLSESLKKVSVKPQTRKCKFCDKIINRGNLAKHQRTKKCMYAAIGWEIRQCQAEIEERKLRILALQKKRANFGSK